MINKLVFSVTLRIDDARLAHNDITIRTLITEDVSMCEAMVAALGKNLSAYLLLHGLLMRSENPSPVLLLRLYFSVLL